MPRDTPARRLGSAVQSSQEETSRFTL